MSMCVSVLSFLLCLSVSFSLALTTHLTLVKSRRPSPLFRFILPSSLPPSLPSRLCCCPKGPSFPFISFSLPSSSSSSSSVSFYLSRKALRIICCCCSCCSCCCCCCSCCCSCCCCFFFLLLINGVHFEAASSSGFSIPSSLSPSLLPSLPPSLPPPLHLPFFPPSLSY